MDLTLDGALLSQGRLRAAGEEHSDAEQRYRTIASLTLPFDQDYILTQALAEYVQKSGYDGIVFSSAMRYAGGSFADTNGLGRLDCIIDNLAGVARDAPEYFDGASVATEEQTRPQPRLR